MKKLLIVIIGLLVGQFSYSQDIIKMRSQLILMLK